MGTATPMPVMKKSLSVEKKYILTARSAMKRAAARIPQQMVLLLSCLLIDPAQETVRIRGPARIMGIQEKLQIPEIQEMQEILELHYP